MDKEKDKNQYPIKVEAQHVGLFETPIAFSRVKEADGLLTDLEAAIRAQMAEGEGLDRSNFGGWHSDTEMLNWGGAAAGQLAETSVSVAKRMSHFLEGSTDDYDWFVRMWANVTPKGGLNHLHVHPGNLWAAVLYVDLGEGGEDSDVGGSFYLEDPRFPMSAMRDTSLRLIGVNGQPQQYEVDFRLQRGNLIVFPAWMRHGVRPYTGDSERISIAMNIDARRKA